MDVLVIYQFCTFGGVERLILNRAIAFKKHGLDVVMHMGFLSDSGALKSFKNYIQKNKLEGYLRPFLLSGNGSFDNSRYDLTLVVDTPQVLSGLSSSKNVFVECHTPYVENRKYLGKLSNEIKGIIVPSQAFKSILINEYPTNSTPIVLTNPVPDEFHNPFNQLTYLPKKPLVYLARLDDLKNFEEALQIFYLFRDRKDVMFIVIGEGSTEKKVISSFQQMGLIENSILRDRIDFFQVPRLINMVNNAKGIFLSSSKGESFGLSAAEFISGGVPVLLSKISVHRELVENNEFFLYNLGDKISAKFKIEQIMENWDRMSISVSKYANKFKDNLFKEAWNIFINSQEM